ncbi:MAG: hypothetical protein PHY34_03045 [Patescibacteria group bacterium]|nr:hypothetical protein [Patescibacteria group bacterium]MDD5715436.1 hypothetical protein [Patescibacteria group bacterium]
MAINLLPSEEKAKIKREKQLVSPRIELTGPVPGERRPDQKPVKHTAGVLTFFKGAFQKPKQTIEEGAPLRQMPEKKILLTEKITYVKQRPSLKPTVSYVAPKPALVVKKKAHQGGSFWSRLFGKRQPVQPTIVHAPISGGPASQFPKYSSVRAEKVMPVLAPRKPRNGDIVQVVTRQEPPQEPQVPIPPKRLVYTKDGFPVVEPKLHAMLESRVPALIPAPKRVTGWQRFVAWLKRIFSTKKKPQPTVPAAPSAPQKPHVPEMFHAQTETRVPMPPAPQIPAEPIRPAPLPSPLRPQPSAVKPAAAMAAPSLLHTMPVIQKPAAPRMVTPPPAVKPAVPSAPLRVPPAPPPPLPDLRHGLEAALPKKDNWLKRLWKKIIGLFGKHTHAQAHTRVPLVGEQPALKHAGMPERLMPPPPPASPDAREMHHAGAPETVGMVYPRSTEKRGHSEAHDRMHVPPLLRQKKGDESISLTQPADASLRVKPFDWEVNLVPEEIVEQEIPISKVLYLVLFIIVTCALVFGGWLWTNFYHNNITTQISDVESKIQSKETEITKHSKIQDEVNQFNARVAGIRKLLANHVYWSKIFTKLEQNTIPDVYLTTLTVDVNGTVQVTAVGKTYEAAVKQLYVFQRASDFVQSATISLIGFQQDTAGTSDAKQTGSDRPVQFTVDLLIYPTIFYYSR